MTILTNAEKMRATIAAAPLLHQYQGQNEPQDAFIELDCENREAYAKWTGEIGNAVPARVWHGHNRRYEVDNTLSGVAIADLLESDKFQALAQRVCDGYDSVWDGNNYVARLNDDAEEAEDQLKEFLSPDLDFPANDCWDFEDWIELSKFSHDDHITLDGFGTITENSSNEELTDMAAAINVDAIANQQVFTSNPLDTLKAWRDELRANQ